MRCWIALHTSITIEPGAGRMDEAEAQRAVASMALGFTPRVALLDEAVLMDVTGSLRLFGGLARLMDLLEQRLLVFFESNQPGAYRAWNVESENRPQRGQFLPDLQAHSPAMGQKVGEKWTAAVDLQPTLSRLDRLPAHIRRAQGATSLIALGRLRMKAGQGAGPPQRVAELPMHSLSAARPHLGVLERTGCRNWGDLLRLPRDGVARRFGAELLQALDRARGTVADEYEWLVLPEHFEEKIELDALVTHAPALMAGAERLLTRLQAWLLGRQSGLSALKLTWHLDKRRDVPPTGEIEVRTAQPAQDLRHVARLLAEQLAQHKLAAPVHSLSLRSLVTEPLADAAAATSSLLMTERKQGDSAVELIERLSARLGEAQVLAWQPRADHRPEQMQRWVPAQHALKSIAGGARPARARGQKGLKISALPAIRSDALYPSWLLPEPVKLAVSGNSPVYQGRLQRLAGPQRLEATGWLAPSEGAYRAHADRQVPPTMRDYYIYRSEQGGLLWIYSVRLALPAAPARPVLQQRHDWYLHGFFA